VKEKMMHTKMAVTFCTVSVLGGALIAGSVFGKADEKNMSDSWITAKTKIALFADSRVKGSDISVATTDGAVTIRGKVDSDGAKQAAESVAKGIDGAKTVKNDLQVVAPSKREATDDKDDAITARVNEQMAKDTQLKNAGIKAQTNAGVVSLSGEVPDLTTASVLVGLASARREIREERSAGERKSLRRSFYSTLFVRRGRNTRYRRTTEWLTPYTMHSVRC
jgi:hyperosmotically inducible protein